MINNKSKYVKLCKVSNKFIISFFSYLGKYNRLVGFISIHFYVNMMTFVQENDLITIEQFQKIRMKVGKIISAELIPKKNKLLKLMVDIGSETREIIAGLTNYYDPNNLIGKIIIVCVNLVPKKIGDTISNGMILAAEGDDGRPILLTTSELCPIGSDIS